MSCTSKNTDCLQKVNQLSSRIDNIAIKVSDNNVDDLRLDYKNSKLLLKNKNKILSELDIAISVGNFSFSNQEPFII